MKNSYEIEEQIDERYDKILNYDKMEIDNPDKYAPSRLLYLDRIKTIITIVKRHFPIVDQIKIGDFACAQGNISLILAELGYEVFAIDINSTFIKYSKMKYEKGNIEWIIANIENLDFPENMLDIAIAGEILEHCAYPEKIIEKILKYVRPGGLLILTTPNGARIKTKLPTFKQVLLKEQRKVFEKRQFGPSGEDHLFLFKLEEIKYIVPKNAKIVGKGYLGGTILVNKYSKPFLKIFPIQLIESTIRILSRVPIISNKTYINIYVILMKSANGV
jgi:2-polyprenyl-3-methyl-5-hydroxy-6-metoxy-1,4-benzoquinol methylase